MQLVQWCSEGGARVQQCGARVQVSWVMRCILVPFGYKEVSVSNLERDLILMSSEAGRSVKSARGKPAVWACSCSAERYGFGNCRRSTRLAVVAFAGAGQLIDASGSWRTRFWRLGGLWHHGPEERLKNQFQIAVRCAPLFLGWFMFKHMFQKCNSLSLSWCSISPT